MYLLEYHNVEPLGNRTCKKMNIRISVRPRDPLNSMLLKNLFEENAIRKRLLKTLADEDPVLRR